MVTGFVTLTQVQLNDEQFIYIISCWFLGDLREHPPHSLPNPSITCAVPFLCLSCCDFKIIPIYLHTSHTQNRYQQAISKAIPFISALVDCFGSAGCDTTERPFKNTKELFPMTRQWFFIRLYRVINALV